MVRIDQELKGLLAAELCAIVEGWDQYAAAAMLGLRQPDVSALRHGRTAGFSIDRLVRLIVKSGYDVEVSLREMRRRFGLPSVAPKVTVQRYDRFGRTVARPAPRPVKRVRRWSGEYEVQRDDAAAADGRPVR
ncbi:MAG: helix-turn-helix domain-containing protein, partial [Gemmatimonadaceae bacterium]